MSRSIFNQGVTSNVYVNTIDVFEGTEPVVVSQTSANQPVNISLKGLTALGAANKVLKMNSSGTALEYGDDSGSNWTLNSGNLYPNNFSTTTVSINTTSAESGYVFKIQGHQFNNGIIRLNGNLETRNGTSGIDYNTGNIQKIVSGSVNATYSFPSSTGTLALFSEIPTNNNQLTNGQGFITASSADTLTNKSISYSQLTGTPTIPTIPANVIANGKTGLTSFTQGDILYYNTGTTLSKLSIGTEGQVLKVSSGNIIEWGNEGGSNVIANGKTGLTSFTQGDILYFNTGTTLSKLPIGTSGQVLKVSSSGLVEWGTDNDTTYTVAAPLQKNASNQISINQDGFNLATSITANDEIIFFDTADNFDKITFSNFKTSLGIPDLTTAVNFGTSATGTIKLGNSQGTAQSASVELYGTSLKFKNTSNVNVATFTPVSNTCKLDLNGGELIKFIASTNAVWNGGVIDELYGGTGTGTYTKGQMLYSSAANTLSKLNIGSTDQILSVSSSGIPAWGTVPVNTYTTITEVPNTNLFLMLDNSNAYKKVTVSNFVQLYQDSFAYNADLPLVKNATNDKYTFSISGLGLSAGSEVNDASIFIQGVSGANTFKKATGLQLQSYTTNSGISFGNNTANTSNRTFGNSVRDSVYNGKVVNIQSEGATKISIQANTITMAQTATDLRVGHSTNTNLLVGNETACCISTIKDLHLFSPTEDYSGTVNRISFIAGSSSSITGIMGYIGSDYSVASGGIPDPANSNNPHNASFVMTSGTQNMFAVCNRTGAFSTTKTQFTIKNDDVNFWTENVTINGAVGQAVLKLNSGGGAVVGQSGRAYVGRDTSTGYIYLGNAVDSSELFSNLTYAKGIEFSRVLKGTKTDTSFSSNQAGMTAFPPVGQQLIQTSTSVGQGYLLNTIYRAPSSTEKYWSCFQIQLTGSHYILGWGTHTGSAGSGSFAQRFYIRSDGNFWGGSNLNVSDRRVKKDIINAPGEECIDILKSIKLKKYRYNDDWAEQHSIENSNYVYGFIAQDIGANPQISYCMDDKTTPISIDGENITDINTIDKTKILSVLWGVCDAQQNKIEQLETKVEAQQTEIDTLKTEIANIKAHLNL